MPGPFHRCLECGKQVSAAHAFSKRCLLSQVKKTSLVVFDSGVAECGNMERNPRASSALSDLVKYCCGVRKMMAARPATAVTTPAVPVPACECGRLKPIVSKINKNQRARRQIACGPKMFSWCFIFSFSVKNLIRFG